MENVNRVTSTTNLAPNIKKSISKETFIFLGIITLSFGYLSSQMGVGVMFNVIMKTAMDFTKLLFVNHVNIISHRAG